MPYKIFRITTTINSGAIGKTAEQLGELVMAEGWESYCAFSRPGNPSTSTLMRVGNKWSILFHVFLTRVFDMCGYGSYFATKRLVREIKNISPDLIHLHNIHSYDFNLKVLFEYLKQSGIPVVWTQHDCWAFTGHCTHYSKVRCGKWKNGCHGCPQTHAYPKSWLFDGSSRNYTLKKQLFSSVNNLTLVAVSKWMKNELAQSFLSDNHIRHIYNGIDTTIFRPLQDKNDETRKKYQLGEKKILIGVAAIWEEKKGIDDYILLSQILPKDYQILLVGVPERIKKRFPCQIRTLCRTESMEELALLYSVSAVCLNLSYEESFGKTTVEAMACGVPCVVYNCTASPELVDEETGIIVKPGDVEGVLNAIKTIGNWDRSKSINDCRERACKLFSVDKNYQQYIGLYRELLNEREG